MSYIEIVHKILIAFDDSIEFNDDFGCTLHEIVNRLSFVRISDDFTIPVCVMNEFLELVTNEYRKIYQETREYEKTIKLLEPKIYEIIEQKYDNYLDEIYSAVVSIGDFESGESEYVGEYPITTPTIFIRDHNSDNRFRNIYTKVFDRIIQVMVDENNKKNPGQERTDKILNMGITRIYTFGDISTNKYGLQNVIYLGQQRKIDIECYDSNLEKIKKIPKMKCPTEIEELPIFKKMEMNSEEYKAKFRDSIKNLRKVYYDSLKNNKGINIISLDEAESIEKKNIKIAKVASKATRKKKLKREKKQEEQTTRQIFEQEILEESYD